MKDIVLLDGAVGTSLWAKAEAAGIEKAPVWKYNMEHPEIVAQLAREYADAGAKIILANTFGANRITVQRSSAYAVKDVVRRGVEIAKEALTGRDVKLALAIGPLSQFMEPYGDLTEEEVDGIFDEMLSAGIPAGADCVMIQTFMDLGTMCVAARAAKKYGVPVYCTMSFEKNGRTLMGNRVEDIIDELTEIGVDAVGMNCSLGPEAAVPIIRDFRAKTALPLIFKPNAGLPITASDGNTASVYTPEDFAREVEPALPYVDYVGGCCGTDPGFIRVLARHLADRRADV